MITQTVDEVTDRVYPLVDELEPAEYHAVLHALAYRRPWRPAHTGWRNA